MEPGNVSLVSGVQDPFQGIASVDLLQEPLKSDLTPCTTTSPATEQIPKRKCIT
jgi:hypothetical protein